MTTPPAPLRRMYDSANMDAIPAGAQIVAGYPHRGGDTVWNPGRFPGALVVAIDQRGDHADDCHAADYEPDAIWPAALLRQWVQSWHQLHPQGLLAAGGWFARPVVYCDLANLPSARAALAGLAWDLWAAAWPGGGPILIAGGVAHQYADPATSGGDYDLSVVAPSFGAPPPDDAPDWRDRALAMAATLASVATTLAAQAAALEQLIRVNTP